MGVPIPTADHPLVLGSASPRRREILQSLHVPHVVFVAVVDEDLLPSETPDDYLVRIVRTKLAAVRAQIPSELAAGPQPSSSRTRRSLSPTRTVYRMSSASLPTPAKLAA